MLPCVGCLSFIYSVACAAAQAFYPPSCLATRADNPQPMVYMNLQPPGGTARRSPCGWWSLTPPSHPYRPTTPAVTLGQGRQDGTAVVFFCLTLLLPIASTFRSGASCAARTFLSPLPPKGAEAGQRQAGTLLFSMRNYYIPAEKPNLFYFFSLKLYLCATFNILHELTRSYCRRTLWPA